MGTGVDSSQKREENFEAGNGFLHLSCLSFWAGEKEEWDQEAVTYTPDRIREV